MAKLDSRYIGNTAYNSGSGTNVLDLTYGGQQGWSSVVGEFQNNAAHKTNQLHAILLEAPKAYRLIDNGDKHIETLKAIIELHSLSISGFNDQLQVDRDQHTVGSSGQVQHEFTNVTREQPSPTHTYIDKTGRPIQKHHTFWIRYLMMDPDVNHPLAPIVGRRNIRDMGAEMYSMAVLYFVPNTTWTAADRAWLCVNMWPLTNGSGEARRDLTQGTPLSQYDIEYSALAENTFGVLEVAHEIINKIRTLNADPQFRRAALQGVGADVAATGDADFKGSVEKTGREAIANVYGV